jgi:hypothetical protein
MLSPLKVLSCMLILRIIATTDMSAGEAES